MNYDGLGTQHTCEQACPHYYIMALYMTVLHMPAHGRAGTWYVYDHIYLCYHTWYVCKHMCLCHYMTVLGHGSYVNIHDQATISWCWVMVHMRAHMSMLPHGRVRTLLMCKQGCTFAAT